LYVSFLHAEAWGLPVDAKKPGGTSMQPLLSARLAELDAVPAGQGRAEAAPFGQ
jgi:hypothetical protein